MFMSAILENANFIEVRIQYNVDRDLLTMQVDNKPYTTLHLNRYNVNHMISCIGTIHNGHKQTSYSRQSLRRC